MPETNTAPNRAAIALAVKEVVVRESRLSIAPDTIADTEPLNGSLLRVNSLGFLGMLVRLEDDLDATLPDDVFVGRGFHTVGDLIDLVDEALRSRS